MSAFDVSPVIYCINPSEHSKGMAFYEREMQGWGVVIELEP